MSTRAADAALDLKQPIDGASPGVFLHTQLSNVMRERIQQRAWAAGDKIPSEHELMHSYGLSRGTVRRAIKSLVDEGLLVQMHGRGTFVADRSVTHTSGMRQFSFAGSLRKQGKDFTTRVIDMRILPASDEVARELSCPVGRDVMFLRRLRIVGGAPAFYHESWLNLSELPGIEDVDFTEASVVDACEWCSGHKVRFSRMNYSAVPAGRERAFLLDCGERDSLLALEQLVSLDNHVPVEWSIAWFGPGQSIIGGAFQPRVGDGPAGVGSQPAVVTTSLPIAFGGEVSETRPPRRTGHELEMAALAIRRQVVEFAHNDNDLPFHLGGSLSAADIMAVLCTDILRTGRDGLARASRDRVVLSKAHASLALYPALAMAGLISQDDIDAGLFGEHAVLFKHPRRDIERGIEMSGGSLGMGLGYAAGLALAAVRAHRGGRIFCIVGDGECNEGSVWEAAAFVGHNRLNNITLIVDVNGMQLDGPTAEILDTEPLARKLASFGFEAVGVDGHDVLALRDALAVRSERPRAVLAHTIKGKGLSFAEGQVAWHDYPLSDELYEQALADLDLIEEAINNA